MYCGCTVNWREYHPLGSIFREPRTAFDANALNVHEPQPTLTPDQIFQEQQRVVNEQMQQREEQSRLMRQQEQQKQQQVLVLTVQCTLATPQVYYCIVLRAASQPNTTLYVPTVLLTHF